MSTLTVMQIVFNLVILASLLHLLRRRAWTRSEGQEVAQAPLAGSEDRTPRRIYEHATHGFIRNAESAPGTGTASRHPVSLSRADLDAIAERVSASFESARPSIPAARPDALDPIHGSNRPPSSMHPSSASAARNLDRKSPDSPRGAGSTAAKATLLTRLRAVLGGRRIDNRSGTRAARGPSSAISRETESLTPRSRRGSLLTLGLGSSHASASAAPAPERSPVLEGKPSAGGARAKTHTARPGVGPVLQEMMEELLDAAGAADGAGFSEAATSEAPRPALPAAPPLSTRAMAAAIGSPERFPQTARSVPANTTRAARGRGTEASSAPPPSSTRTGGTKGQPGDARRMAAEELRANIRRLQTRVVTGA